MGVNAASRLSDRRRIVAFVRGMSVNPSVDQPAYAIIKNFADYVGATFTTI